jgi:hypothetical protein
MIHGSERSHFTEQLLMDLISLLPSDEKRAALYKEYKDRKLNRGKKSAVTKSDAKSASTATTATDNAETGGSGDPTNAEADEGVGEDEGEGDGDGEGEGEGEDGDADAEDGGGGDGDGGDGDEDEDDGDGETVPESAIVSAPTPTATPPPEEAWQNIIHRKGGRTVPLRPAVRVDFSGNKSNVRFGSARAKLAPRAVLPYPDDKKLVALKKDMKDEPITIGKSSSASSLASMLSTASGNASASATTPTPASAVMTPTDDVCIIVFFTESLAHCHWPFRCVRTMRVPNRQMSRN